MRRFARKGTDLEHKIATRLSGYDYAAYSDLLEDIKYLEDEIHQLEARGDDYAQFRADVLWYDLQEGSKAVRTGY